MWAGRSSILGGTANADVPRQGPVKRLVEMRSEPTALRRQENAMTSWNRRATALALAAAVLCGGPLLAAGGEKKPSKDAASFGVLNAPTAAAARQQAETWLKATGKTDAATQKAFASIWDSDRPTLDRV